MPDHRLAACGCRETQAAPLGLQQTFSRDLLHCFQNRFVFVAARFVLLQRVMYRESRAAPRLCTSLQGANLKCQNLASTLPAVNC
jgi:hypothetical protein